MRANRLADATSPYLQQHAENPVDWWPWCDEALALAREQDKPILLSVGYSACHWCHVMAHESFEDPATAAVMNALYVNIKVDREERPDLDRIYQTAHQLLSRRPGGWPLTVFLTPNDHSPFFAGTYFPPKPRHGLPAFADLLRQVEQAYRQQRDAIDEQNASLRNALSQIDATPPGDQPDDQAISEALQQLAGQFDATNGGFGGAPKFPHPGTLRLLLREGVRRGDETARHMALHTLERMANGGINDHLGGGFCRYSVDEHWMIPHFEKMLYDNGQLLALYAEAWLADGRRPLFRHVCERIAEWVMREMQSPDGGYFASLDADSEGEEGKFYVWTPDQVAGLLEADEYKAFAQRFGLDRAANFEGSWHLHTYAETAAIAAANGLTARDVRRLLLSARNKLLAERDTRVRPGRDEKILTSWNALMIKGMAKAGRLLDRSDWVDSAVHAMAFLRERHWRGDRLLATSRDGAARLNAYLDDYAFLADAGLELLQARWDSGLFTFVERLGEHLLTHFEDHDNGGFFFTSDDHEHLVHRPKPLGDDAVPSGNGVAIEVMQHLALLSGGLRFHDAAGRALRAASRPLAQAPYAHVGLLEGLRNSLAPPELLVIRGPDDTFGDWQQGALKRYVPGRMLFGIDSGANDLPPGLADKQPPDSGTLAYRCHGNVCDAPIEDPGLLS